MKSKQTHNGIGSSPLKSHKTKKPKKSKKAKILNVGVKKIVENENNVSKFQKNETKPSNIGCVNRSSSLSGVATSKKKGKRGKSGVNASVGDVSELQISSNVAVSGGDAKPSLTSPSLKKKKTEVGKSGANALGKGSVNGGRVTTTAASVGNGESPKKPKKKRSRKKRKSADSVDVPRSAEMTKFGSDGGGNHAKKGETKREEQAGDSPNCAQTPVVVKRENGVLEDQKSVGKKKREKFKNSKNSSLREKMLSRLSAARFRFINEELYTWDGQEPPGVFASDPKSFKAYHLGFRQQTKLWPVNPIDVIIRSITKLEGFEKKVIADFGCGEAKLASALSTNKVYSFDLVAIDDRVTVCDNANTNLYSGSVDVAVHCLSLMSSNISGYVKEANRVLRIGGLLKIAEVESRFEDVDKFVQDVCKFNFKLLKKDLTHNLFYFMDFEKVADIGVARKRKLPVLTLQPCLYKKR